MTGYLLQRLSNLGLLFIAVLALQAAASQAHNQAQEYRYREALFHMLTNDYVTTMTLLEQPTGELRKEKKDSAQVERINHSAQLLALDTSLHLGMRQYAKQIFSDLEDLTSNKRAAAKLALRSVRKTYSAGDWQQATQQLTPLLKTKNMGKDDRDEALYYLANSLLQLKQVNSAAKVLSGITPGSIWAAYGYYNLGIYYAQNDAETSRALVSLRVASAMTGDLREDQELYDRIQLAAGNIALQDQSYDKAMSFLANVRASGTSAGPAIYGYGRAYAGLGQNRAAIQTWYRAKKYALVVPGVADTYQAIAESYVQENLQASAIDAYLEAIAVYEKELRQIDQVSQRLHRHGVLQLLADVRRQHSDVAWFLATDLITNTPLSAFANFFMAEPEFFQQAKELLMMEEQARQVNRTREKLDVFASMLRKKANLFSGSGKQVSQLVREKDINSLVAERNALAKAFVEAEKSRDYQRLLEADYAKAQQHLESTKKAFQDLNNKLTQAERAAFKDRIARLEGLILWRAMDDYKKNHQELAATLNAMDSHLQELKNNFVRLQTQLQKGKGYFQEKLVMINQLQAKYADLETAVTTYIEELQGKLTRKAIDRLVVYRGKINHYHVRSQLALVNLYDDIAIAEADKLVSRQERAL